MKQDPDYDDPFDELMAGTLTGIAEVVVALVALVALFAWGFL